MTRRYSIYDTVTTSYPRRRPDVPNKIKEPFEVDGIHYDYITAMAGNGEELDGNYCATQPMFNLLEDHENVTYEGNCYMCKSYTRGFEGMTWSSI